MCRQVGWHGQGVLNLEINSRQSQECAAPPRCRHNPSFLFLYREQHMHMPRHHEGFEVTAERS